MRRNGDGCAAKEGQKLCIPLGADYDRGKRDWSNGGMTPELGCIRYPARARGTIELA
jgi:hypothetical protein